MMMMTVLVLAGRGFIMDVRSWNFQKLGALATAILLLFLGPVVARSRSSGALVTLDERVFFNFVFLRIVEIFPLKIAARVLLSVLIASTR